MSVGAAACRVCQQGQFARELTVKEMMLGTRRVFGYGLCAACGSLSLLDPPESLEPFYPSDYYSFAPFQAQSRQTAALRMARLVPRGVLRAAARLTGSYTFQLAVTTREQIARWAGGTTRLPRKARLLDVGCGSGERLLEYFAAGLDVEGIDPYYTGPTRPEFTIRKIQLDQVTASFHFVTFNDSLEHMPDPAAALAQAWRLLVPGGICAVSIPKLPSVAFELYGTSWFHLDAPRHFFVPSVAGIKGLAERIGFQLTAVEHHPTDRDLLWCEAYRRDVPLAGTGLDTLFTAEEARTLRSPGVNAHQAGRSCHAAFILRK